MAWHPIINLSELPSQGYVARELEGRSILIGRAEGRLFACLDRCPHAGAPLRVGTLRGEELQCPRHGWLFNVVTGNAVPDDPTFRLTQLPIKIDGTQVFVEL
jgi:nitrite reductase/ring-hydroxylating ferredoxin subunit